MAILILYIVLNSEFTVNYIIFTNVIIKVYDDDDNGKYYNYNNSYYDLILLNCNLY